MKKTKVTQKEMAFYKLYRAYKEDPNRYVSAWEFVGEMHIPELQMWVLMSYKTPTNGLTIFHDNPGFFDRKPTKGKSGATYFAYRIAPNPSVSKIADPSLKSFYELIHSRKV